MLCSTRECADEICCLLPWIEDDERVVGHVPFLYFVTMLSPMAIYFLVGRRLHGACLSSPGPVQTFRNWVRIGGYRPGKCLPTFDITCLTCVLHGFCIPCILQTQLSSIHTHNITQHHVVWNVC